MPVEIEAKMRVPELAPVAERLRALGAAQGPVVLELNTFFDTTERVLLARDTGVRIRVERDRARPAAPPRVTITHKGPRLPGAVKARQETELTVDDAEAASALLAALGYQPMMSFEKRRQKWTLQSCHVELDTLPHLGHFVEIEGPSEDAVLSVRRELGLDDQPLVRESYSAMLAAYAREHGLDPTCTRFDDTGAASQ